MSIINNMSFDGDVDNTDVKWEETTPKDTSTPKEEEVIKTEDTTPKDTDDPFKQYDEEQKKANEDDPKGEQDGEEEQEENQKTDTAEEEDDNIITALNADYGIEGEFEESAEGFKNFTKAVVDKRLHEEFDKLFETTPDIKEYIEARQLGFTPEQIASRYSTSKRVEVELKDEASNIPAQKQILRALYAKQGIKEEKIEKLIQRAEDSKELYSDAVDAQKEYNELITLEQAQEKADREAALQAEQERVVEYWDNVREVVKKGDIGMIKLNDQDKGAFYDYISKPIDNKGRTAEMLDREKMKVEDELALRFMLFKKFDIGKYITSKAKQLNFQKLKETKKVNAMKGGSKSNNTGFDHIKDLRFKME